MNEKTLFEEIRSINERLSDIDKSLAINVTQLEYHIKRTDMLQTKVTEHERQLLKMQGILLTVAGLVTTITVGVQIYATFVK